MSFIVKEIMAGQPKNGSEIRIYLVNGQTVLGTPTVFGNLLKMSFINPTSNFKTEYLIEPSHIMMAEASSAAGNTDENNDPDEE